MIDNTFPTCYCLDKEVTIKIRLFTTRSRLDEDGTVKNTFPTCYCFDKEGTIKIRLFTTRSRLDEARSST